MEFTTINVNIECKKCETEHEYKLNRMDFYITHDPQPEDGYHPHAVEVRVMCKTCRNIIRLTAN